MVRARASAPEAAISYLYPPVPEDFLEKKHHRREGKPGYVNPWPSFQNLDPVKVKQHMKGYNLSNMWKFDPSTAQKLPRTRPSFIPVENYSRGLRATWLGHACYLVEYPSGLRVLFDPVFTHRCSPVSFMGPKRVVEMPCQIADIPVIDIVVISHNHYDHLSYPTIKDIAKRHPHVHFFAPLGNKAWFQACGISNMIELDWWEEVEITIIRKYESTTGISEKPVVPDSSSDDASNHGGLVARVGCLPAQHNTGRTLSDTNNTLWASWSVKSGNPESSVYFAGDTGYQSTPDLEPGTEDHTDAELAKLPNCPAFKQIGELRGPFTLGLLPIGAYSPRYLMAPYHANTHDSVEIFKDTKCQRALAMHWGTWVLGEEALDEPPRKLKEALQRSALPAEGIFDVCAVGESREYLI